jgi:hypothetical protein
MQISDAELGQVRDLVAQTGEVAAEQIHVAHGAEHAVGLVPVRVRLANRI